MIEDESEVQDGFGVPEEGQPKRTITDWGDYDHASTAIVEAMAAATGQDVIDLPPLQESVDVDALETLVQQGNGESNPQGATPVGGPVEVTFEYHGYTVVVASDRSLVLRAS
jgi:hypothetical protein